MKHFLIVNLSEEPFAMPCGTLIKPGASHVIDDSYRCSMAGFHNLLERSLEGVIAFCPLPFNFQQAEEWAEVSEETRGRIQAAIREAQR